MTRDPSEKIGRAYFRVSTSNEVFKTYDDAKVFAKKLAAAHPTKQFLVYETVLVVTSTDTIPLF